jgi:hypothetical protein
MGINVVETIWHADKTQRVDIFQREDGTFGFAELHYAIDVQTWCPFGRYSESFTKTSEAAISEARSRVSWAADREENHK